MLPYGNPRLWTPDELGVPARYLHKGNVDRAYGGRGIGTHLYDWARSRAARDGAEVVRLNVWTRNLRLHEYYLAQGMRLVRTVPGRPAGTLFEAPTVLLPDLPVAEVGEIELPA
jgi:ribosomal protein S18 acetylase RimI-like enzyme